MKNIRYYIFWILDFFKGSPIRKHYKEIQTIFYGGPEAEALQKKLLYNILSYAVEHTQYYSSFDPNSLSSFPVINKGEIISNMDNMFSKEFKAKKDSLNTKSTSGSSGSPFKIYQDPNKVYRNTADVLFFYDIGGYNIGDRMYYMRIWTEMNKKPAFRRFMENFRMFDTANLDKAGATSFVNTMTGDTKKKVVLGFPTSFSALMEYFGEDEGIDWNIKSVFSGAEALPLSLKRDMERFFKCPIMSRYSNQENGMLAQQPITGEDYYVLNPGSYFIEFLELNSDAPADEMEEARIVVTDLFNKAVPMIRYDTEDIGCYTYQVDKNGRKRKVIHSIMGREADYLYSNTRERISPYIIITLMWKYIGIRQCQLIQEDFDEVTLKVVFRDHAATQEIEERLSEEIFQVFGQDTKLTIQVVDDIPMASSGKRKYIVSNIDEKCIEVS